ncbi:prepilin-type N-terminal cleavage/methylation domain-containing protein [Methyloradius palustris]|uniref:Prepilin-type cleavage/methylation domain-containing protein n=1 Tax=Methyloradius palustris TaxID=2778876 RepID=A0A8D5G0E5_9PROT|nr:prepilin-type N-terminal cleavage/methylation domain-containing protein [Methyloradius palustris]BCM23843.1 hypothetical protein ZMTM_01020 [Methyloradius palustris]
MINSLNIHLMKIRYRGFTLVEMAVVLVIVGLLLGGVFVPLTAQLDQRNATQTQKTLTEIKESLLGYTAINGRLPCPADNTSAGLENPLGGGACVTPYAGFVPGVTLGITPTDTQGFAIDGWGNRIHYAVTTSNSNAYTTVNGLKAIGFTIASPNLYVCSANGGSSNCGSANSLTTSAPAVIYSIGKNGLTGGTGIDESQNPNPNSADNNAVFVSHDITASGAPNGEFDDMVVWLSNSVLINRMLSAGQLP